MVQNTDQRHSEVVKHVLKSTVDAKKYFGNNEEKC